MAIRGVRRLHPTGPWRQPAGQVRLALALMAVTLLGCSAVSLTADTIIEGVSWFGVNRATVLPFAAGMFGSAWLLLRAAGRLPTEPQFRQTRATLTACGVLLVALPLTPYTAGTLLNWVHMGIGASLFLVQLGFAGWLWRTTRRPAVGALLAVQVTAGLVALASLPDLVGMLLYGQVGYELAFAGQLVIAVDRLAPAVQPASS